MQAGQQRHMYAFSNGTDWHTETYAPPGLLNDAPLFPACAAAPCHTTTLLGHKTTNSSPATFVPPPLTCV